MPLSVDEDDLTLKAEIYSSLLHIHIDRADWKGALQLLDKAIRDMPRTRHQLWVKTNQIMRTGWRRWEGSGTVDTYSRKTKYIFCILSLFFFTRPLLKYRIQVKARLGESILLDMQKLQHEGEQCCSVMWHRAALWAGNVNQQLTYYQNSITSLLVIPMFQLHFHISTKTDASANSHWDITF